MSEDKLLTSEIAGLKLRFATEADTAIILQLINQLATFEKLASEVVTDEATLKSQLFEGQKVAEVILAEYHNQTVGFALFFHNFSTFLGRRGLYLEDLFVKEQFRGLGIGKQLLTTLARIAHSRNCGRIEWWVLNWNQPAIKFYKNLKAKPMDEWTVYRLEQKDIESIALKQSD